MMKNVMMALAACLALGMSACGSDDSGGGCPIDTPATCGDGVLDVGEMCDQGTPGQSNPNFGNNSCSAMVSGTTGQLRCQCCMVDTTLCIPGQPNVGGNGG